MNDYLNWIMPLVIIYLGFAAGIIFDKFILDKLKRLAIRARLPGHEIIFQSFKGVPKILFLVAGFYGAVINLELNQIISSSLSSTLQKALTAIFLYAIVVGLARLAADFVSLLTQRTEGLSASLLSNIAKIIVFIIGILMILQTLGFYIVPILAALGIGGLAIALAFQETLANIYSGLYLLISKQVRPGDYVKLETGQEGYVTDITWRNTVIREIPNNLVIVPNSKLASAIFTNYHLPAKEITLPISLGVSYDSDLEKVERVTIEVAREVLQDLSECVSSYKPFVRYQTFGEFSITFTVYLRVTEFFAQRIARHEFIKRLHRRYQAEGIKIPFPVREVYTINSPMEGD